MTLNGVMAVTLRYFTEFGKLALQKTICGGIYARVYCILVRVQCRRKESSRSLSRLLMSFLYNLSHAIYYSYGTDKNVFLQIRTCCLLIEWYLECRKYTVS